MQKTCRLWRSYLGFISICAIFPAIKMGCWWLVHTLLFYKRLAQLVKKTHCYAVSRQQRIILLGRHTFFFFFFSVWLHTLNFSDPNYFLSKPLLLWKLYESSDGMNVIIPCIVHGLQRFLRAFFRVIVKCVWRWRSFV